MTNATFNFPGIPITVNKFCKLKCKNTFIKRCLVSFRRNLTAIFSAGYFSSD